MRKRLFISVSNMGWETVYQDDPQKIIDFNKRFPDLLVYGNIYSYDTLARHFLQFNDKSIIILLPDNLINAALIASGVIISNDDYLVHHSIVDPQIQNRFFHKIQGQTSSCNATYETVFNAIIEGESEDEIVNRIIARLWPDGDDWKVKDEFLNLIFLGQRPEDILKGNQTFKGVDISAFMNEYLPFNEKSYTLRMNDDKIGADDLYIALRDKMITSK